MNRIRTYCLCFVTLCLLAMPSMSIGQAQQRPISAFVDAQSATTYPVWYDPATDQYLLFDAFGKRNENLDLKLGTTFDGRMTVRTLADGRAHVSVDLHTKNGLCWGYKGGTALANLAFGNRPSFVALNYPAALGDGVMRLEFMMPSPNAPLPDFWDLGYDPYPLELMAAVVNCTGELRAASGYPDGTPGKAHTTQTGLFMTGVPSGCPPEKDADCFPSEIVRFWPVGK